MYDRRVERLRSAVLREDTEALAAGLYEVQLLALWRARNVTDFDAFAEHVVGMRVERARKLAAAGAAAAAGDAARGAVPSESAAAGAVHGGSDAHSDAEMLSREFVALWLRTEAALIAICPTASVRVVRGRGKLELELRMPADPVPAAVEALRGLGPALTGLAKLTSAEVPERAPRPRR